MTMTSVSVIIPVYNGRQYLPEALTSLLNQTLGPRLQIIVVDDGSDDGSFEVVSDFSERYPGRIKALRTENHGAAHARNKALSLVDGEYVGFLDCDDTADVTMFEKLYLLASQEGADIATCGYYRVEGDDVQRRDYVSRPCFGHPLVVAPSLLRRNVPYVWNKLFRTDFLRRNNLAFVESLRIYEDLLFTYEAFALANKVVRVTEPLYVYNFARANSLTVDFTEKRLDIVPAFQQLVEFYRLHGVFDHVEDELLRSFLVHFYAVLENSSPHSLRTGNFSRFVSECFAFLDREFPWWRKFDSFFKQTNHPAWLYTNRTLISLILRGPRALQSRMLKERRAVRKMLGVSKAGIYYTEALLSNDVNEKTVVIDSQRGANLNGNMFYILMTFIQSSDYADWKICLTYRTRRSLGSFRRLLSLYDVDLSCIVFQKYNSTLYARNLATARLVFTDTSLPVYYLRREGQVYLNTWHGTPLKALGRDMEQGYAGMANLTKNFLAADYLAFQSAYMSRCMKSAYMYEGLTQAETILDGYPRNCVFKNAGLIPEQVREAFQALEEPSVTQRIAYLPTWRGSASSNVASQTDIPELLGSIDALLDDSQVLYVKLHPYDSSRIAFSDYRHVKPFPTVGETYAVLSLCDALVTDYSSVFFDFCTTGKPIVLFTYDKEDYLRDRGLYLDFDSLGLPTAATPQQLVEALARCDETTDASRRLSRAYAPHEASRCPEHLIRVTLRDENPNTMDPRPERSSAEDETILFCGDFRSIRSTLAMRDALEGTGSTTCDITYTLESSTNLSLLKHLPRSIRFLGRSYPLSATTEAERRVLAKVQVNPEASERYRGELLAIAEREVSRAWPRVRFANSIVYGPDTLINLVVATCCARQSILALDSMHDISFLERIPDWILDRFTLVLVPEGSVDQRGASDKLRTWHGLQETGVEHIVQMLG